MTALYLIGDVFERIEWLRRRGERVDMAICSPPFLALRSYLPDGHPQKHLELGSEPTPAAFIDGMLVVVARLAEVLAPHGSLVFELGDTYAGSGGAGGDYDPEGLRAGAPVFSGSAKARRTADDFPVRDDAPRPDRSGRAAGWPLDKSLCGIPQAFMLSLIYGYNVLDRRGPDSPAGRWRVRNLKPWIRSNPPVGALGDKERPATSYVIVATRDPQRFFDLDAVRTQPAPHTLRYPRDAKHYSNDGYDVESRGDGGRIGSNGGNAAGAPPRDWCHSVDMVLDAELDRMAGKPNNQNANGSGGGHHGRTGEDGSTRVSTSTGGNVGARGVHLRRALERAGILRTLDALDVSPKGYRGAHYAVWPPELVRLLVDEMCPRRVCSVCGQPSRRIVETERVMVGKRDPGWKQARSAVTGGGTMAQGAETTRETVGWSDCGCPGDDRWQPGTVLDPFVGSGTTLAVASGMGRDSIGIDIDTRNALLALERVGPLLLAIDWPEPDLTLPTLPAGAGADAYTDWEHRTGTAGARVRHIAGTDDEPPRHGRYDDDQPPLPSPVPRPARRRQVPVAVDQGDLFATT